MICIRFFRLSLSSLVVVLVLSGATYAQDYVTGCEENEARLDIILTQMEEAKDQEGVLILIARLGDGEKSLETSRRRLHNAKEYLRVRREVPKIPQTRVVTALGERASGYGRIDYISTAK